MSSLYQVTADTPSWARVDPTPQGNGPYDAHRRPANKSLREARVVGRIVTTAARSADIFVRGNTRSDARTRMSDWNS
jgi:hypothetical protein